MDPTGFAPVSSDAKADMLLHTPQARVHDSIVNKKSPFFKKLLLLASDEANDVWLSAYIPIIPFHI